MKWQQNTEWNSGDDWVLIDENGNVQGRVTPYNAPGKTTTYEAAKRNMNVPHHMGGGMDFIQLGTFPTLEAAQNAVYVP